ncbi:Acyltransferase, partial [Sarracenia purpurea var. burkii]
IFGFLDVENKGKITFKQFLLGSAHVLKQPLFRPTCELAFAEWHTVKNHYVSEEVFGDSIRQAIPNLDGYEVHELFKLFDTDGDGRMSKDDFISCLRRNPLLIELFSRQLMHKNLSKSMTGCERRCDELKGQFLAG